MEVNRNRPFGINVGRIAGTIRECRTEARAHFLFGHGMTIAKRAAIDVTRRVLKMVTQRFFRHILVGVVVLCLDMAAISAQTEQRRYFGGTSGRFGNALALHVDVGGSAHAMIVGNDSATGANGFLTAGRVAIFDLDRDTAEVRRVFERSGSAPGDRLGTSVAALGDLSGDGTIDYAAGAPFSDATGTDAGSVIVFSAGGVALLLNGVAAGDQFGTALANVGDLTGDGSDDLAIGAPFSDVGFTDSGSVTVVNGVTGAVIFTFHGTAANQRLGIALCGGGDANGDGTNDIVAGALGGAGLVRVFSGAGGGVLFSTNLGASNGDQLGRSLSFAGNLDGVAGDEILAGAPLSDLSGTNAGRANLYAGANGALLFSFVGAAIEDRFGTSVAAGADFNGDGVGDLLIGAARADGAATNVGSVTLYSGATQTALWSKFGQNIDANTGTAVAVARGRGRHAIAHAFVASPGAYIGFAGTGWVQEYGDVSPASPMIHAALTDAPLGTGPLGPEIQSTAFLLGDVDADGTRDIAALIGVTAATGGAILGRIEVRSGSDGSLLHIFDGPSLGRRIGPQVVDVGDLDLDGYDDFALSTADIVLAPSGDRSIEIRSGATGSLLSTLSAPLPNIGFGSAMANVGDQDGDAMDDLAVCAPSLPTATGDGAVYLFSLASSQPFALITRPSPAPVGEQFGQSVAAISDSDGDGKAEILIGTTMTVEVYGSLNMAPIRSIPAFLSGGVALWNDRMSDVDADGFGDFIIGGLGSGAANGVYSGATFALLYPTAAARFVGDVNADGFDDFAEVSNVPPQLIVRSGADFEILDAIELGAGLGGSPRMAIGGADLNGDGLEDLVLANAQLGLAARVVNGALRFGEDLVTPGGPDLSYIPEPLGGPMAGRVRMSGAASGGIGAIGLSLERRTMRGAGPTVLIEFESPEFLLFVPINFDAAGAIDFSVDLRQPSVAGRSFYAQAIDIVGSAVRETAGLCLRFGF